MKTKNKLLALLEIAIVLCSLFLVALPAIAAEQTTQEVSANTITTASEDDYVLGIYGNANEDDTIDMRDLTYVKLIFFGKKPETELADAKYDGKINPLDFIQIKLIIVGKEKELTIIDDAERTVTIEKPVERVVSLSGHHTEGFVVIGASDRIVGVSKLNSYYFPELLDKPVVGSYYNPDYEMILEVQPDIVFTFGRKVPAAEKKLKPAGITLIGLDITRTHLVKSDIVKMGYIMDKKDKAEEYIEWREKYEKIIKDYIDDLSEDKKPKVFIEWGTAGKMTFAKGSCGDDLCTMAGGKNIAHDIGDISYPWPEVDPEWVITQNPDVILTSVYTGKQWSWKSTEEPQEIITEISSRPGWDYITAVKNSRVHAVNHNIAWGADSMFGHACWAKCFYPELDIDPEEIYKEYLERFMGLEYPEDLIFVYPPPAS